MPQLTSPLTRTITRRSTLLLPLALMAACGAVGTLSTAPADAAPARTLQPYRSESELTAALDRWRAEAAKLQPQRRYSPLAAGQAAPMAAPAPATSMAKSADSANAAAAESITNVQTAGVDEGGIVKRAGDHLIILRRGRLFTVRVGGDALQPQSMIDAYAPGADPRGAWYDELLVSGSTVVVVGYSYARGGTEIGLFELGSDGSLAYRATYHLRSFDYYSARNYASRLIGNKLVFYTPTVLNTWGPAATDLMPAVRRWTSSVPGNFERILPATRIYRTDDDFDPSEPLALHSITSCELGGAQMRCESTAVLGPPGRVFYVSTGSVYVWTNSWRRAFPGSSAQPRPTPVPPRSAVFRIPLDGSAPTALKTAGVPIDQMSFLEGDDAHLNVLLRESGPGESMFGSEAGRGAMALLRVPLSAFGDGRTSAQAEHYRRLPAANGGAVQNRYIGDWLLWGSGSNAWATRYASAETPTPLEPGHQIERIEALGQHAVLVGNSGSDLIFSALRLNAGSATPAGRHVQGNARQGETRTHGFFYRATGAEEGLLGLPVLGQPGPRNGVYRGEQGAASVVFLRQRDLRFTALGELQSQGTERNDACKASCVDWYGNARPLFLGERIFALMGYELVEGRLGGTRVGERIEERRRISFAPNMATREGRYSPFN